jgi:hypothetical protein
MMEGQRVSYKAGTKKPKKNSVTLVRERTMPTERPPLVGKVVPTLIFDEY